MICKEYREVKEIKEQTGKRVMKIVGFKTRKPKPFSYKPLYYDQKKEELENLKRKYAGEKTDSGLSPDFRDRLRASYRIKEKRTGNISKVTLVIYFALAALLIYYLFF